MYFIKIPGMAKCCSGDFINSLQANVRNKPGYDLMNGLFGITDRMIHNRELRVF